MGVSGVWVLGYESILLSYKIYFEIFVRIRTETQQRRFLSVM